MKRRPTLILRADAQLTSRPHAISTELKGSLHLSALESGLAQLMQRHDALRVSVELDVTAGAGALPRVHKHMPVPEIFHVDLGPASYACGRADAVRGFVECQIEHGFDLQRGPLWSCAVARLEPAASCLVLCAHPLIADFAALALWLKELERLYRSDCASDSLASQSLLDREATPMPVAQRVRS